MNSRARITIAALSTSVLAVAFGGGLAQADPIGAPTYRELAGVGSDTTQDVDNALAQAITIGGVKPLGSYDATGSANITTKDPATLPACTIPRPFGSGAGKTALINSKNANAGAGDGCLQFSRSSSAPSGSNGLTYIPFAVDSISYGVTNTSDISRNLSKSDLQQYYQCNPAFVGASAPYDVTPMLPQAGSGTRIYWVAQMGITEAQIAGGTLGCLINGVKNGQPIEEHTGTVLDDKSIVPFSIGQFNSQATQTIADKRGRAALGVIDNTIPNLTNTSFSVKRKLYHAVPTSSISAGSTLNTVFVGPTSLVCSQPSIIQLYGFGPSPECGETDELG